MNILNNIIYWDNYDKKEKQKILSRPIFSIDKKTTKAVTNILNQVKKDGDIALKKYNFLFDKIKINQIKIDVDKIKKAKLNLNKDIKKSIKYAYKNIHKFHSYQLLNKKEIEIISGVFCQQIYRPINSVGLYIPGGTSSLFSTVLMLGIPAQLALCPNIIICSPPPISNEILYSSYLCGIKNIFQIGGAQAIAAMAFGTESIKKVDKIFGPGNFFVTEAKKQITRQDEMGKNISIDMPAGPSELMIIADRTSNYNFIIADLLSQAEHGSDSQVILLTPEIKIAKLVKKGIFDQLKKLPRRKIAEAALNNSYIIVTKNIEKCIEIANQYAPEHLIIQCNNYKKILSKIFNAGSIFLGHWAPESVGDYASGTNHVLPTYGYASTHSCLGVYDFQKRISVQKLTKRGLLKISRTVEIMSKTENLLGHKNSITIRKDLIKQILSNKENYINKIVRKNIINLIPYQSARLLDKNTLNNKILLNANESPIISIFSLKKKIFNRYPEPQSKKLIYLYSKYVKLNSNNILISRGADEGIDLIMRTFCNVKYDKILFCPPTYGMYLITAKILDIKYIKVASLKNWNLNINEIKKNIDNVKIIYICNPNNPTGNIIRQKDIIELLKITKNKSILVIDEAYIEFCSKQTSINLINKYHNLIILRTLSKAFSLAGLRCGFILSNKNIINLLIKVIAPYPIPTPVIDIAIQALSPNNLIIIKNNIKTIMYNKRWLILHLKKCNLVEDIFHSTTNYILVRFFNASYVLKKLSEKGIIIRDQSHELTLQNCLRITIGTYYECKKLIFELHKLSY
ncbi:histidinol dehydrogenase [Enterobacteriaceae endosymbiont of Donacia tomentosa]|nr:histidinol dehydrogenase [Enterobacteriaceae endosymbiont of Donacia tomentosa]